MMQICVQMHPKDLSILDFTYDLPASKIASYPLEQRDASKLWCMGRMRMAQTRMVQARVRRKFLKQRILK